MPPNKKARDLATTGFDYCLDPRFRGDWRFSKFVNSLRKPSRLLTDNRYATAILRPSGFVAAQYGGAFFALADGLDGVRFDAVRNQIVLHSGCAAFAESQVVFAGAAFVTMTFDGHFACAVFLQPSCLTVERRTGFRA